MSAFKSWKKSWRVWKRRSFNKADKKPKIARADHFHMTPEAVEILEKVARIIMGEQPLNPADRRRLEESRSLPRR